MFCLECDLFHARVGHQRNRVCRLQTLPGSGDLFFVDRRTFNTLCGEIKWSRFGIVIVFGGENRGNHFNAFHTHKHPPNDTLTSTRNGQFVWRCDLSTRRICHMNFDGFMIRFVCLIYDIGYWCLTYDLLLNLIGQ